MDSELLVKSGAELVRAMDRQGLKPRAAVWVLSTDTETWRLWIVPGSQVTEKANFYRQLADVFSANRDKLPGLDIGSVEYKSPDHPVVKGMSQFIRMEGLGSVHLTNNRLNGVFLPDGIVLRMAV